MTLLTEIANPWNPNDDDIETIMLNSEFKDLRQFSRASNYVFLATLTHPQFREGLVVYKPAQGEQPLWDFPPNLYQREVAAYQLSRLLNWNIIPPTIIKPDGPHGIGSIQLFINHDPNEHYFYLQETLGISGEINYEKSNSVKRTNPLVKLDYSFLKLAILDIIINNADRKAGHILRDQEDNIWGIDNGLSFHTERKLRTVIWDYSGVEIPTDWSSQLEKLHALITDSSSDQQLFSMLSEEEISAMLARLENLIKTGTLPEMFYERCVPWPLI
jgi:uncharacterized repeat protein (TIGR03843 family)